MNLPQPPPKPAPSSVASKSVLLFMAVIIAAMALLAVYANVQRWRRDKVETIIITPAATSPSPTMP